jgi:hypothetical protein
VRTSPTLAVVAVAAAVVCGGCGGSAKSYDDVQGCLGKLGVASAFAPAEGTTTTDKGAGSSQGPVPATIADVRFRDPGAGAPVVHLVFYKSRGDAKKALEQGFAGGIGGRLQPDLVSRTVLVSWATPPTQRQRQLVTDCLEK